MMVRFTIVYPGVAECQSVTIFGFVGELTVDQFILLIDRTLFDDSGASHDCIDDVYILRRADLQCDGCAVVRELVVREIEPVIGLCGRTLVIEREHDKLALSFLVLVFHVELVLAGRDCVFLSREL